MRQDGVLRNMDRGFVMMQVEWIRVDKQLLTEGKVVVLAGLNAAGGLASFL